jgi:hypothetical protein
MDWEAKARQMEQVAKELAAMLGIAGAGILWWAESGWGMAFGCWCVLCAAGGLRGGRI